MDHDCALCLLGVTFSYGGPSILQDIDLEVPRGEFLGLVGPNGGGKSTLVKLALGLLQPQQGQVFLLGRSPRASRRRAGYVPQYAAFPRDFPISVQDAVLQARLGNGGGLRYARADREAAARALAQAQVSHLAHRRLGTLSGGQLQRVLMARALAGDPELLLLDEPTANIDMQVEEGIFDLLHRLNGQGLTIVVISHDIGLISSAVTRVACLSRTLVCHRTAELTGEVLATLYGGHSHHLIDHGVQLPSEHTHEGHQERP
jgi:zinc transport system ATP-binding protein